MVQAVTHYKDPKILASISKDLGFPMRAYGWEQLRPNEGQIWAPISIDALGGALGVVFRVALAVALAVALDVTLYFALGVALLPYVLP